MWGRMFIGRNGPDHLSMALMILALILNFVPWPYMFIISTTLLVIAVWRMFSRNIDKRRRENFMLMKLVNNTKAWYYRINARRQQYKQYKIFKCPQCGQRLRVPRGKGKVAIKCSKCGNKLIKTT
jgi:predicted RNA-binding Zn-ribbon protein involved in translation (DUF1610 family)